MLSTGTPLALAAIAGIFVGMNIRDRHAAVSTVSEGDGEHRELMSVCQ
jgi:hypothetical protein